MSNVCEGDVKMRIFLCGGGCGKQTIAANKKLNSIIDHSKPILYIPLAMKSERYSSCYEWIKDELKDVDVPNIDMVVSSEDLFNKNLENYSALFIGGGNTFKLLKDLKDSGSFEKIKAFIENNGIVFGGSAGAIILGQCIDTCKYADKNEVELKDLMGFDVVSYFSFLCHFTNQDKEKTELNKNYLLELSKEEKIIALPEEDTIYYENGKFEIIGNRPFYIFEEGNMISYNVSQDRLTEFLNLNSDTDLMNFMNQNITYGWKDFNQGLHFNNLKGFRENYRTSSIDEILETGLGTCIEQAKMIKFFFDKIGLENKLYCHRSYETEENFDKEVKMHCFVLFKYNDSWYHFEHSNRPERGIHKYDSIESAIGNITSGFGEKDIRTLTEISEIPSGLTFKEFNDFVNSFDKLNNKHL